MALKRRPRFGLLGSLLDAVPGRKTLGVYRFLPFFFLLGAGLEFTMINWTFGQTNFYKTYKKRQVLNTVGIEED